MNIAGNSYFSSFDMSLPIQNYLAGFVDAPTDADKKQRVIFTSAGAYRNALPVARYRPSSHDFFEFVSLLRLIRELVFGNLHLGFKTDSRQEPFADMC